MTRLLLILAWLAGLCLPAMAHGSGLPVVPDDIWHHWTFDPWITVPLIVSGSLYLRGVSRLWSRAGKGRGVPPVRVASFTAGLSILVLALVSPLDALGETLLTAHMIQHAILVAIAPPLLLAGWPAPVGAWALPTGLRRAFLLGRGVQEMRIWFGWALRPIPATVLHGAALWLWHAPGLYDAALRNEALHTVEHVSFFATAMFFWYGIFRAARSSTTVPAGIAASFLTLLHGGFLSALITFAPHPLYSWYIGRTDVWGIDALSDQQLAGLIMGAPLTMVYLGAGLALVSRLLTPASPDEPGGQQGLPQRVAVTPPST